MEPIKLRIVKSTKGTHVYGNDNDGSPVNTLYIKRSALPKDPPPHITVTIEHE